MSHVSTESTIAPRSAGTKPAIINPGTMSVTAQKRSAFRMKENNPNVMIVIGSVRIFKTGLITMVMTDHTRAIRRMVSHPPATVIPGTRVTVR